MAGIQLKCKGRSVQGAVCASSVSYFQLQDDRVGQSLANHFKICKKHVGVVNGKLQTHESLQCHRDAATRAQAFILSCHNSEQRIQHHVSQQARENYERNFQVVSVIVKAILYCWRQNIALRDHCDDWTSTSSNKGNFMELLKLLGE